MRLLSRAEVESAQDLVTEDVPVPEWGPDAGVRVKVLSCTEHKAFSEASKDAQDDATISAHLAIAAAIDADGKPLFTTADLGMLTGKSAAALKRIGRAAARLNRMHKDAAEDTRKNS